MAIIIKELVIKLTVNSKADDNKITTGEVSQSAKNKIIKECVDKVLERLELKIER